MVKRGPGRPPKNPAAVARAVDLCDREGLTPEDAAARVPGTSQRTVYRALERRRKEAAGSPPSPVPSSPAPAVTPAREPPSPPVAASPPEGLSPKALRRWIVEQQIATVRTALALAESRVNQGDMAALSRLGALNKELRSWLQELAELQPEEAPDPAEEDRRWRAEGEAVVRKIKAGIEAVEARLKRERAGTG